MKPLFTQKDLLNAKSNDKLPCQCYHCESVFYAIPKEIRKVINNHKNVKLKYCSIYCARTDKNKKIEIKCHYCNNIFLKSNSEFKKSINHFCSRSCSASYNNINKSYGVRRSKLEKYIEEQLTILYPSLHIDYNKKEAINSELDIYIPSLKLAIELNGVFHYEPIFGEKKLSQTQNNDKRKLQACIENKISFCTIDTSSLSYFKEKKANKFLKIIIKMINNNFSNISKN